MQPLRAASASPWSLSGAGWERDGGDVWRRRWSRQRGKLAIHRTLSSRPPPRPPRLSTPTAASA